MESQLNTEFPFSTLGPLPQEFPNVWVSNSRMPTSHIPHKLILLRQAIIVPYGASSFPTSLHLFQYTLVFLLLNPNSSTQRKNTQSQDTQELWLRAFFPSTTDLTKHFTTILIQNAYYLQPNSTKLKEKAEDAQLAASRSSYSSVSSTNPAISKSHEECQTNLHQTHNSRLLQSKRTPHSFWPS